MGTSTINNDLLTVNEAMAYTKCKRTFLWQKRKEGLIRTVKAGNKVLITKASIDSFLKLQEVQNG